MVVKLLLLSIAVIVINIPFGYWRANVKKFSLQWVMAVHVPVIFVVALRILISVGFAWYTFVFLVTTFFIGQSIGAFFHKRNELRCSTISSCLIMDILKKRY